MKWPLMLLILACTGPVVLLVTLYWLALSQQEYLAFVVLLLIPFGIIHSLKSVPCVTWGPNKV